MVPPDVVGGAGQVNYATEIADGVLGLVVVDEADVRSPQRLFREIGGGLSQDFHVLALLGVLLAQTLQLGRVVGAEGGRIVGALAGLAILAHPIPQRPITDSERSSDVGDGSTRRVDERHRLLFELGRISGLTGHGGLLPSGARPQNLGVHQTVATPDRSLTSRMC